MAAPINCTASSKLRPLGEVRFRAIRSTLPPASSASQMAPPLLDEVFVGHTRRAGAVEVAQKHAVGAVVIGCTEVPHGPQQTDHGKESADDSRGDRIGVAVLRLLRMSHGWMVIGGYDSKPQRSRNTQGTTALGHMQAPRCSVQQFGHRSPRFSRLFTGNALVGRGSLHATWAGLFPNRWE